MPSYRSSSVASFRALLLRTCCLFAVVGPVALAGGIVAGAALSAEARADEVSDVIQSSEAKLVSGEARAAEIDLKKAVKAHPDRADLRLALGRTHLVLGDLAGAEGDLVVAREKGGDPAAVVPTLAQIWLLKGDYDHLLKEPLPDSLPKEQRGIVLAARTQALIKLQKPEEAEKALAEAESLAPASPPVLLTRAMLLESQGKYAEAEAKADEVLKINPKSTDALAMKGDSQRIGRDFQSALQSYDAVLAIQPNSVGGHLGHALSLVALDRANEANADVDAVLKVVPKHPGAQFLRAQILARQNKLAEAWQALQPAMADLSHDAIAQVLAANLNAALGNQAQARSYAETAVGLTHEAPFALQVLGDWWARNGDLPKAIGLLEKAHQGAPENPRISADLGALYGRAGRGADAAKLLEQASKQAPEDEDLKLRLGLNRLDNGNLEGAGSLLEDLADKGKSQRAEAALVPLYLREGRLTDAQAAASKYAKEAPGSALSYFLKGRVELALGDGQAAEADLKGALAKEPAMIQASLALAGLYHQTNRTQDEGTLYADILKRDPLNEVAHLGEIDLAIRAGHQDQALKLSQDALAAQPESTYLTDSTIRLLLTAKQFPEAVAVAQKVLDRQPGKPNSLALLARTQLQAGKVDEAVATLRQLAEQVPGIGHLVLAQALFQAKQQDQARAALDLAVAKAPGLLEAWQLLLADEAQRHGVDSALALSKKADSTSVRLGDFLRGDVLFAAKRFDEAAKQYQAAYADASKPERQKILPRLHEALIAAKHTDQAQALLTKWLEQYPNDLAARTVLANQLMVANNNSAAAAQFELLLKQAPSDVFALNDLAVLYGKTDPAKALDLAKRAHALAPNNPQVTDTYAWLIFQGGDAKQALPLLDTASQTAKGEDPSIQYHLAAALVAVGDAGGKDKAKTLLQGLTDKTFSEKAEAQALATKLGDKP